MIKVDTKDFSRAVRAVLPATKSKTTLDVLRCILIEVDERGAGTLRATDLDRQIVARFASERVGEGAPIAWLVPGADIDAAIRSIRGDVTELGVVGVAERVGIRSGVQRFEIPTLNEADMPLPMALDSARVSTIELAGSDVRETIARAAHAASTNEGRPNINGVLLEQADDKGFNGGAIATDGHRMVRAVLASPLEAVEAVTLPNSFVAELVKLVGDGDDAVTLRHTNKSVEVELGDVRITSRLIDGAFPAWRAVWPTIDLSSVVTCDRAELLDVVRSVARMSGSKVPGVILHAKGGALHVSTRDGETTRGAEDEVRAGMAPDVDRRVQLNPQYVIESLSSMTSEEVEIALCSDGLGPCVFRPVSADGYDYGEVMMPMRLG